MFTNFKKFKPYMTAKELERFMLLYESIQSPNISLQQKVTCYTEFNKIVNTIRKRIQYVSKTKKTLNSKVFPIRYEQ